MQPPAPKRLKTDVEIVNFRPLIVKAYEYFELLALNKINSLTMQKHKDALT